MTFHKCHCGEVHDNTRICPQPVFELVVDDFDRRLASAFMEYMRAHDAFWKGIKERDRGTHLENVRVMNRAMTVCENIARERETFPNTRLWKVEDFDVAGPT